MSAGFPNSLDNNSNQMMGNNEGGLPLGLTAQGERPCRDLPPVVVYASPVGWNAVIVGLLSCILALVFLLTCLYYLAYRRRYMKNVSECPSPVPLVEKASSSANMANNSSPKATTPFTNETGKDANTGDFVVTMPTVANGHASPSHSNGLLVNANADQSELRLLQHEEH